MTDLQQTIDNKLVPAPLKQPITESKDATKNKSELFLDSSLKTLLKTVPDDQKAIVEKEFDGYKNLFGKFVNGTGAAIIWDKIEKLPEGGILSYNQISSSGDKVEVKAMLDKLVVVKLNGGLGTSMGCSGPKSVISVRDNKTFLDLTVQQIEFLNNDYDVNVPLVLMNSFNTHVDTMKVIRKFSDHKVTIKIFNQSRYPRIDKESLMPIAERSDDSNGWYPPGHGDFYKSFSNSELLNSFIKEGKKFVFISNIDNLGATVDLKILEYCMKEDHEFVMEVTDKTRADIKGGTLIQYEGKLRLLEAAQVPKDHIEDFKSVKKFNIFNTNNLWINLEAIKRVIDEDSLDMEVIVNPKELGNGQKVYQLETAVGDAMKCFNNAVGINVPRSRFLPVKKTSDLFLVMSNIYNAHSGTLTMSSRRMFPTTPIIKLGDQNFKNVGQFLQRFSSIPDIVDLHHLTVSGDITFGKDVILKGTVIIIANHGERIDIPDGAVLENKIVSGNIRILDH